MNLSTNSAAYAMLAALSIYDGASLTVYAGSQPTTPETALLGGNTVIATYVFATPAFPTMTFSGGEQTATASLVANSVYPTAAGVMSFARATLAAGSWTASHAYALNAAVSNGSNYYVCAQAGTSAASGGPAGTGRGIADNTCSWNYWSAVGAQNNVLGDFSIGTSNADIIIANTNASTTVPVEITSFQLQIAAA